MAVFSWTPSLVCCWEKTKHPSSGWDTWRGYGRNRKDKKDTWRGYGRNRKDKRDTWWGYGRNRKDKNEIHEEAVAEIEKIRMRYM